MTIYYNGELPNRCSTPNRFLRLLFGHCSRQPYHLINLGEPGTEYIIRKGKGGDRYNKKSWNDIKRELLGLPDSEFKVEVGQLINRRLFQDEYGRRAFYSRYVKVHGAFGHQKGALFANGIPPNILVGTHDYVVNYLNYTRNSAADSNIAMVEDTRQAVSYVLGKELDSEGTMAIGMIDNTLTELVQLVLAGQAVKKGLVEAGADHGMIDILKQMKYIIIRSLLSFFCVSAMSPLASSEDITKNFNTVCEKLLELGKGLSDENVENKIKELSELLGDNQVLLKQKYVGNLDDNNLKRWLLYGGIACMAVTYFIEKYMEK